MIKFATKINSTDKSRIYFDAMTICYFSATGNSLYVARRIGGELLSIPQLMRQDEITIEDDAIGVVCPWRQVRYGSGTSTSR